MLQNDPRVLSYDDGVSKVAYKIILHKGPAPYIAVIYGSSEKGKKRLGMDVMQNVFPLKYGEFTPLHDIRRGEYKIIVPNYILLPVNHETCSFVELEIKKAFNKYPDLRLLAVSNLERALNPPQLTLEKVLEHFDLVVENPLYGYDE